MKIKVKIDLNKLEEALKHRKKSEMGFIAKEWEEYFFQPPSYNVGYSITGYTTKSKED
jgi:hypothetical protein